MAPDPTPSKPAYEVLKRLFDLVLSSLILLVVGPVMGVIALVIRRDGGPALYRSPRVGRHSQRFHILKFRTMILDADKVGPLSTAADDPRITRVGAWLRQRKLDELPQLFNVLAGSMSLVGPRPQIAEDVADYSPQEMAILSVRPGITDWASIQYRDEGEILKGSADPHGEYIRSIRPGKVRLGLAYVQHRSLRVDAQILALTALALFDHDAAVKRLPQEADR